MTHRQASLLCHDRHPQRDRHADRGPHPVPSLVQPSQHRIMQSYRGNYERDSHAHQSHHHLVRSQLQHRGSREPVSRCLICSFTQPYPAEQKPVFHSHFSSLRLREQAGAEDSENYPCPSCKCSHEFSPEGRTKIVLSDFSLHRFFSPPNNSTSQYVGDLLHVDYITIPEGCIEDLVHAFRLDYELSEQQNPLDVVIVAGYNDLLKNNSRNFIMEGFRHLSDIVLNLGKTKHPGIKNTFAVASLLYPPRLAWFPDNGATPLSYKNDLEKINWLNGQIHELNLLNSVPDYPRFHTYGVRTATRTFTDVYGYEHQRHVKSHRWEHWEVASRTNKLTLKPERKFKIGTALNNYFALNTS